MRPSLLTWLPRTVGSLLADFKAPAQRIMCTGKQEASFFGRKTSSCPQRTDCGHDATSPRIRLIPLPTREVCFAQPRVRTDVYQHVTPPECHSPAVDPSEPRTWRTQPRAVPEEVWHDGIRDPRNARVATRPRACSEDLGGRPSKVTKESLPSGGHPAAGQTRVLPWAWEDIEKSLGVSAQARTPPDSLPSAAIKSLLASRCAPASYFPCVISSPGP